MDSENHRMPEPFAERPFSALRRFARQASRQSEAAQERCDLCGEPAPHGHRHLLEASTGEILCACRACSILFEKESAGRRKYRLIPDRRVALPGFEISESQWESLRIPVGIGFFLYRTTLTPAHAARAETRPVPEAQQAVAFFPGPMGPTEAYLEMNTWAMLQQNNPVLGRMEPDVEALLVNRARGARQYFLAPIDECYRLVGLIRLHWKGLSGGQEVWKEIKRFFEGLEATSIRAE